MPTERLYYDEPYRVEFRARVVSQNSVQDRVHVILDRTCFYPGTGGQPPDTGELGGQPVLDVFEGAAGTIVHVVPRALAEPDVAGRIDWPRRFDHMQQHTGQHILSAAFEKVLGTRTIAGFHLGADVSTVDLDRRELTRAEADRVEDLSNQVVAENRPVTARVYASIEDIEDPALRNAAVVEESIRIVAVTDFDACPCGGTHVRASGEVGPIKITGWERRKDTLRVRFLCGRRALADYRWKSEVVQRLAEQFNVGGPEVIDTVTRLSVEADATRRQLVEAKDRLLDAEAAERVARAGQAGLRVVQEVFAGREPGDVRGLAQRIIAQDSTVALLGLATEPAQLVFARSADVSADMGAVLSEVCRAFGGRGGGRPHWAQGGGFPAGRLEEALAMARGRIQV